MPAPPRSKTFLHEIREICALPACTSFPHEPSKRGRIGGARPGPAVVCIIGSRSRRNEDSAPNGHRRARSNALVRPAFSHCRFRGMKGAAALPHADTTTTHAPRTAPPNLNGGIRNDHFDAIRRVTLKQEVATGVVLIGRVVNGSGRWRLPDVGRREVREQSRHDRKPAPRWSRGVVQRAAAPTSLRPGVCSRSLPRAD